MIKTFVGQIVGNLLFGLEAIFFFGFFYLVVTPFALAIKLFGRDPLRRAFTKDVSYRVVRN